MARDDDTPAVEVYSVGDGSTDIADKVAGLLRSSQERLHQGAHHTHFTPQARDRLAKAEEEGAIEASSLPPEGAGMLHAFTKAGALEPLYPPDMLLEVRRQSNSLRQNIDAYATNVDGFGFSLESVVDLDSDEARDMAAAELRGELEGHGEAPDLESPGWEKLVDARLKRLRRESAEERTRLRNFWDFCGLDVSFTQLRKRTRVDLELFGWGAWEVLKNMRGELAKFVHIPAHTLRILPADPEPRQVCEAQRTGPFSVEEVRLYRHFRRYIHWQGGDRNVGRIVYFKDWGDERLVSRSSGRYYSSVEELRAEEGEEAQEARELLYFDLHNPDSYYGEPRWMGNLLSVLGSRESEEVNYLYFRNKSVPPMVLLISGGQVGKEDKEKIQDYVERELKGTTASFHRILIITAKTDSSSGDTPKIEFKPLTDAMLNEAVFQSYDERNIDKVGSAFRLPRLLRGDIRDFNRATADAALRFTESQVFSGERADFDFIMNRRVMSRLGARFWRFRSNPPPLQDPEAVVDMVEKLVKANVMTPAEGRRQLAKVGIGLDVVDEPWTRRPVVFTLSGVGFEPQEGERIVQTPEIARVSEEGEPAQIAASASNTEEGLRLLEQHLYGKAGAGDVTPETLRSLNREDLEEALRQVGIEGDDLEKIVEALVK